MAWELICEGKYKFHKGKGVIALGVNLGNLPDFLTVYEHKLLRRSEFHVSLFCGQRTIEKYNISILDFENKVKDDFCEFVKMKEIRFLNYKNEFRFAERDNKKTVVVMCEVSNLNEFFDFLNQKYSMNMECPPTHVTLYTLDGDAGIALINEDDIKNLTKSISNPIGFSL